MARIPPETIEQIAAANDIVDVIGGYFPLKRAGGVFKALCPFHQEKSPSFTVTPSRQRFKCFGCNAGGSVFDFVMLYEHLEFAEAARRLAERAGIRIVEQEFSAEDQARVTLRRRLLALHAEVADWFHRQLLKTRAAQAARDYLKGRGINSEIARAWKLGYAPDSWHALAQWTQERGFSADEISQSGLVKRRDEDSGASDFYDTFRDRVMFPICSPDTGEVIAFSGRVLQADAKTAKYVNSPETTLFTKGAVLFGLDRSKRPLIEKKSAIVCEGQLDLITAFEAGVQNVIAPQGTAFTARQARLLHRYVEEVVLCFDADAAGQKAAERSVPLLLAENLRVRVVEMPPGEDPDSLIRSRGAAAFTERVAAAKDFFEFQLDRASANGGFSSPQTRAQLAHKLAGWAGSIGDAVLRQAVINRMSVRLEVSPEELSRLVRKSAAAPAPTSDTAPPLEPTPLDPKIRILLLATLHEPEARDWLLAAPWRDLLAQEPDAALPVKIIEAGIPMGNPAAVNVFLTTLAPEERLAACNLFDEKPRRHEMTVVQDCWNDLLRRQIERRIDASRARMRAPDLAPEETFNLSKEIVDLQKRLRDIPRPLSPPL